MKKAILLGIVTLSLMASIGIVAAKGPYNATGKNPNLHDYDNLWPTALDLQTNSDGDFVQWYRDRHYICQCTADMNPDAINSKLSEGWFIWHPAASDPRHVWCNEYIIKMM